MRSVPMIQKDVKVILRIYGQIRGALMCRDGIPAVETLRLAPPKIRPKKILVPDENETAAGRMQWILSGGVTQKKGARITGDTDRLADGIVEYLVERNFITRSR